ncbi:MAG: UDP-N-acetylglucosamine 1-carboxyvinyltransferase [Sarcina sp.]
MKKILVRGGISLSGEVNISSAKNSVLPIMAASLLADNKVRIMNYPILEDVNILSKILEEIGCEINLDCKNQILEINSRNIIKYEANFDLVKKMRGSFLIMGPMLAKYKKFTLACPGGCNIGSRPIDLHLKGFELLGATIKREYGYITITAEHLKGNDIYLDFPSVGATENIMMAATLSEGRTIINNPALEPEIEDLANFLNSMGAKVQFNINSTIIIDGVNSMSGTSYKPIFDRIEGGTFLIAAALTKSEIKVNGILEDHLKPVIEKLRECGVYIDIDKNSNIAIVRGSEMINSIDVTTMPHPGFPTDMQSQIMSLLTIANGTSVIEETVFENRFMHAPELIKMGADIKIKGNYAIIKGIECLTGTYVKATDLRAGAALILAGLVAKGETIIDNIYHIDRGYMNIEEKFENLGAEIKRIEI